jgi:hypothetical protein
MDNQTEASQAARSTVRRSGLLLIALVASAIVCAQNVLSLTGFGWALIHGAGIESALAFAPAAVGLALVWAGYFFIRKKASHRATPVFAALAIGVIVLNELVLPVTPFQMWRNNRALKGVRVLEVRDEPLLSAQGNPIGVRISFDAVVPRTTAYGIYGAAYSLSPDTIWPLGFGYLGDRRVDPAPTPQPESPYDIFQKDVVYTISQNMVPVFLRYDEKTKEPCLAEVRTKYISEADFLTALGANRSVPLKVAVSVNGEYNAVSVWVAERVTSHRYDMQAIYDTIAKEGGGRCAP